VGLTALTAASFCVFLTRVLTLVATFLVAALRANGFVAAFRVLTAAGRAFAAAFFAGRALAALRAGVLPVVALLAFGFDDELALATRFAVFAAGFAFERDADRLRPFVRLLLMGGISKRLLA
jgi:hypothetical protein